MDKENSTSQTVSIYEILKDDKLHSREQAEELFIYLTTAKLETKIIFDFSNIDYISRSFADELLKKNHNRTRRIKLRAIHMEKQVENIIKIVTRTFKSWVVKEVELISYQKTSPLQKPQHFYGTTLIARKYIVLNSQKEMRLYFNALSTTEKHY